MSIVKFRSIALSMPQAFEGSHMEHPDFRMHGKIFASLFQREGLDWGMVKLTPKLQSEFVRDHPTLFQPVKGGWGRQGCTQVRLPFGGRGRKGETAIVRRAVEAAWELRRQ
jgi:hypothetical protein